MDAMLTRSARPRAALRVAVIGTMTAALTVRLLRFVDTYAVDVPFWDQWDFLTPLFQGDGLWAMWRWQHGPVRLGLGGLVIAATTALSGWNMRADAFVCAAIVVLAAVAALALARVVRGRWVLGDVAIPFAVLTTSQYENLVGATNPAAGPVPLLLVFAFALALMVRATRLRLALATAIAVAASHTTFAVFLSMLAIPVFGAELLRAWRQRGDVAGHGAALAVTLASLALMFYGWRLEPGVECFAFPDPEPSRYAVFAGVLFLRGLELHRVLVSGVGVAIALSCAALAGWGAYRLSTRTGERLPTATFVLAGFSALYAVNLTLGRSCLGEQGATASRYATYLVPFLVAAYLVVSTRPAGTLRFVGVPALCAVFALKELLVPARNPALFAAVRRGFVECYRATGDLVECNSIESVHPDPAATHLDAKIVKLRERRLSLFRTP